MLKRLNLIRNSFFDRLCGGTAVLHKGKAFNVVCSVGSVKFVLKMV